MTSDQLLLSELDVRPIRVDKTHSTEYRYCIIIDGTFASRSIFDTDKAYFRYANERLRETKKRKLSKHERRIITRLTNDSR